MFFEKIRSEGLAQLSYIAGDGTSAFVIDPHRDCRVYREIADREGAQITHIFETHRNEDFVIGSCELAAMTGATIYHGAGSVCGLGMAAREFSTLGYERQFNPALQAKNREQFIDNKLAEQHYAPPYFKQMERLNLEGQPAVHRLPHCSPLSATQFAAQMDKGMLALDTRSAEAFSGASIPGSLAIPLDMIPAYAGWFIDHDQNIGVIVQSFEDVEVALRYLFRLGYEKISGFLDEGLHTWEIHGNNYQSIPSLYAGDLKARLGKNEPLELLDVRKVEEVEQARLPGSRHIFLGELPSHVDQLPTDRPIITFCGSGQRAIIAASLLKQKGFEQVENCLGSMAACQALGCKIENG